VSKAGWLAGWSAAAAPLQVIDYGHPQSSSSEALKEFVLNQPVLVKSHVHLVPGPSQVLVCLDALLAPASAFLHQSARRRRGCVAAEQVKRSCVGRGYAGARCGGGSFQQWAGANGRGEERA